MIAKVLRFTVRAFIAFNALCLPHAAHAISVLEFSASTPGPASPPERPTLKEFGVLISCGAVEVIDQADYVTIPVFFRFGVDCDKFGLGFSDWIERAAHVLFNQQFRPAGMTEFLIEPFIAYVPSPERNNMESGLIVAFKYEWPLTEKFHPYIWNGGGAMYITQHLKEQATQWNFTPQIGFGFHYALERSMALNFEYRYRHFSNANLKLPNDGIDQEFWTVGISWLY